MILASSMMSSDPATAFWVKQPFSESAENRNALVRLIEESVAAQTDYRDRFHEIERPLLVLRATIPRSSLGPDDVQLYRSIREKRPSEFFKHELIPPLRQNARQMSGQMITRRAAGRLAGESCGSSLAPFAKCVID